MKRGKKNPAQWDGKSGKLPTEIGKKLQSKRISFRIPKPHECKDYCEDPFESTDNIVPATKLNSPRFYTPEAIYNAKSQYARFERALELFPAKIEILQTETVYWYPSCDAPDGFWRVRFGGGATFIKARQILNIVCPAPYKLTGITSDGESFIWEQLSGNRTVLITPPNVLEPTILLLNYCDGNGCDDGSSLPIVLKVSVAGRPDLFDFLTIYNTPTSNLFFGSYGADVADTPCLKVDSITPTPAYVYRGYQLDSLNNIVNLTWSLPQCDNEYLIGFVWQQNIDGQYVDVEPFLISDPRFFEADVEGYYRVAAVYNYFGVNIVRSYSRPVFFAANPSGLQKRIFGDDTHRGLSYGAAVKSIETVIPSVIVLEVEDSITGLSYAAATIGINDAGLGIIILEQEDSMADISYAAISLTIVSLNLGGILIR